MNARETVSTYFDRLYGGDWEGLLADDMLFVNNGRDRFTGKEAYAVATRRFMKVAQSVALEQLVVDGERVAALSRYGLVSPKGNTGTCLVAEFFTVRDGRIAANEIVFDLAGFNTFMAGG